MDLVIYSLNYTSLSWISSTLTPKSNLKMQLALFLLGQEEGNYIFSKCIESRGVLLPFSLILAVILLGMECG